MILGLYEKRPEIFLYELRDALASHPQSCHKPPTPARRVMDAIVFVLRTGCQWNALNATGLCSSSVAHRRFQEWSAAGGIRGVLTAGSAGLRRAGRA